MRLSKIQAGNTKRVSIADYFEEGDYITIKKLNRADLKKISFYSVNTLSTKMSKHMFDKLKDKGADNVEVESEVIELFQAMSKEEMEQLNESTEAMERVLIDKGLDTKEHSIQGEDGQPVLLNYEAFLEYALPQEFIDFVIKEIKSFSESKGLGKQIEKSVSGQSKTTS